MAKTEQATLGGGCFWCLEAVYQDLRGVQGVVSGYAGGESKNPSYEAVCSGRTGHAEVVQLTFNPDEVSYRRILEVFFTLHDPTTLNRQGGDIGTQYRSVIYYHDDAQKQTAEAVMKHIGDEGLYPDPLVTELEPLPHFYEAEAYHQNYYRRNPYQGYCNAVITPKVSSFRKLFSEDMVQRA